MERVQRTAMALGDPHRTTAPDKWPRKGSLTKVDTGQWTKLCYNYIGQSLAGFSFRSGRNKRLKKKKKKARKLRAAEVLNT